jgi:hypothetical protein
MIDIYADENKPVVKFAWTVHRLALPDNERYKHKWDTQPLVYVTVEEGGLLGLDDSVTVWFGDKLRDAGKSVAVIRNEIYEWLIEWGFAEWRNIGPEDRELFATKLLDPELGID